MSRLPSFVIKNYERQWQLSNTLLRKLNHQRLLIAFHLNDPSLKQQNNFRAMLQAKDPKADYRHVRNGLTRVALRGTKFEPISPLLESVTGMAMSPSPVMAAAASLEFVKANPAFVVVGGVLDGRPLNKDDIKTLADLPADEKERQTELGSRVHAQLMAPYAQLISVLTAHQIQTLAVIAAKPDKPAPAATATAAAAAPAAASTAATSGPAPTA